MSNIKVLLLIILVVSITQFAIGQVGINTDGSDPHESAMLDIKSTDKGILIPRVEDVTALIPPGDGFAEGLLVFQTEGTKGFYYFDGASWQQVGGSGGGSDNLGNHIATQPLQLLNLTTAERDAISNPTSGMMIYNSETGRIEFFQELPAETYLDIPNNGNTETGCTSIAQSFVPANASINEIGAKIDFNGGTGDVILTIYDGEGIAGTVLYTETYSFASLTPQNGNEYDFVLTNPYLPACCPPITFEITQAGNTNMTAHIDFRDMVAYDATGGGTLPDGYANGKFYKDGVNSDENDTSGLPIILVTRRDLDFKVITQNKQWTQ
ncbi:MAG: hypothetical protein AAGA77_14975 [Bacteroidota bacterium]